MPHNIELFVALLTPFIILTALRINAAMVFLSVCLGYVLVELVAKDADSLISFLAPQADSISRTSWQLLMLFTPVVLTAVMMIWSIKGRVRVLLNMLPAAAASVLMLLLAIPLLTPGLRHAIQTQTLWSEINQAQAMIVGLGAFTSLVFLWLQRGTPRKRSHSRD